MLSFEEFQDYCKEHLVGALPDGYEMLFGKLKVA